jgi:GTP-binding protein
MVAIVGRPNVGKSTLFNRLVGYRAAIVHDTPGVTRDKNIVPAAWRGRPFLCVDTGGFEADEGAGVTGLVQRQSRLAIAEADVVVFVFDGRAGLSPADRDAVNVLRRAGRPVIYAVNKIDTAKQELLLLEFTRLGVEPLVAISAEHARGIDTLMQGVLAALGGDGSADVPDGDAGTRLALVGRPNVGKSSLLNRLAGTERAIVDATPGTTRDPTDTPVTLQGRPYVLVDTAGVRRRAKVTDALERLTAMRSLRAIESAEIALLVLDATEGMTDQDARIAAYAWQRGRAVAFVINKWDLEAARGATERQWVATLHDRYPTFATIPALCVSAVTGQGIAKLPGLIEAVEAAFAVTLPTRRLNQVLKRAVAAHAPHAVRGRVPRFLYATQVASRPPLVAVFTTHPDRVQPNYVRYLQGQLGGAFEIVGIPIRLDFRRGRPE